MSLDDDLQRAAGAFDKAYTDMTALQRELIFAVRDGSRDPQYARKLILDAETFLAAWRATENAVDINERFANARVVALRTRIVAEPMDGILIGAVIGSVRRNEGFGLLADVLERVTPDRAQELLDCTVAEAVALPKTMGVSTARRLVVALGLPEKATFADLTDEQYDALVDGMRDVGDHGLPDGVLERKMGRHLHAKPAADGAGAGPAVLHSLTDAAGPRAEPGGAVVRDIIEACDWPLDAVPVCEMLIADVLPVVAGGMIPGWDDLLAEPEDERYASMTAQARAWRGGGDDHEYVLAFALEKAMDAMKISARARRFLDAGEPYGSQTPVQAARQAARRLGDLLSYWGDEQQLRLAVAELLPGDDSQPG